MIEGLFENFHSCEFYPLKNGKTLPTIAHVQ